MRGRQSVMMIIGLDMLYSVARITAKGVEQGLPRQLPWWHR